MNTTPVFVGTVSELEQQHNETLNDARCRSHSSGTCPSCPEDICPLCQGSGRCTVAAVDAPDAGVLELDTIRVTIPCVSCVGAGGKEVEWPLEVVIVKPDYYDLEVIGQNGGVLINMSLNPQAHFKWVAPPGRELDKVVMFEMTPKRKDGTPW